MRLSKDELKEKYSPTGGMQAIVSMTANEAPAGVAEATPKIAIPKSPSFNMVLSQKMSPQ